MDDRWGFRISWILEIGCLAVAYPLWDSGERGAALVIGAIGGVAALVDWWAGRRARAERREALRR